ncbi:hypothetical protein ABCR94_23385 [Streptomyces sp. 21So2-11]|uniref:DUF7847 domain-containing protein n=1 Tax=Streptomyces sp. 21So2-11 TaxID=3144408 RepID=UPI0032194C74
MTQDSGPNGPHHGGPYDTGPQGGGPYDGGPHQGQYGGPYAGPPPPGWPGWTPPPPKPGVIPLGPLALSDILGGSFTAMGRYWKQLFGIAVLMYGAALLVSGAALAVAISAVKDDLDLVFDAAANHDDFTSETGWSLGIAFGAVWLVAILAMVAATATIQAACPAVLQDAVLGRRTTIGAVWRRAWPRVPAVIGVMLLPWLAAAVAAGLFALGYVSLLIALVSSDSDAGSAVWTAVGFVGFLAMIPLVTWAWVLFSLAPSAVVFESQRPVAALRRSIELVRGSWWRIFGITTLAGFMAMIAGYLIQIPFTMIGMLSMLPTMSDLGSEPGPAQIVVAMGTYVVFIMLGAMISQIFATTFPQLVTGLLYVDQRIRKENLAPVLAESAAVPPQPAGH